MIISGIPSLINFCSWVSSLTAESTVDDSVSVCFVKPTYMRLNILSVSSMTSAGAMSAN